MWIKEKNMKEILGSRNLENAFDRLAIFSNEYSLKYSMKHNPKYCIWEVSDEAFQTLRDFPDDKWKDNWGWWRSAEGCNLGEAKSLIEINGYKLLGWRNNVKKEDCFLDWQEEDEDEKESYDNNFEEYYDDYYPSSWINLLEYFGEEFGCFMEKNVCALAVDLAKANEMTMAELFKNCGD